MLDKYNFIKSAFYEFYLVRSYTKVKARADLSAQSNIGRGFCMMVSVCLCCQVWRRVWQDPPSRWLYRLPHCIVQGMLPLLVTAALESYRLVSFTHCMITVKQGIFMHIWRTWHDKIHQFMSFFIQSITLSRFCRRIKIITFCGNRISCFIESSPNLEIKLGLPRVYVVYINLRKMVQELLIDEKRRNPSWDNTNDSNSLIHTTYPPQHPPIKRSITHKYLHFDTILQCGSTSCLGKKIYTLIAFSDLLPSGGEVRSLTKL